MNPNAPLYGNPTADGPGTSTLSARPPRPIISRYVIPLALLAGFAALAAYSAWRAFEPTIEVKVVSPVAIAGASASLVATTTDSNESDVRTSSPLFKAPGWVEPDPYPVLISSLTPGSIETIGVIEGDTVTSGDVIARLVDDDAALAVSRAQADLELKRVQLEAAKRHWETPTTLEESIALTVAERDRLVAERHRMVGERELARKEASVGRSLQASGFEPALESYRKRIQEDITSRTIEATDAQLRSSEAALRAAREKLQYRIEDRRMLGQAEAEVAMAEVRLAEAQLRLERCVVRAPLSGIIMAVFVRPGSMVSEEMEMGMQIASIYDPENLQLRVEVPLGETSKLRIGLPASIELEALPGRVFSGRLTSIVPKADIQKNILPVKVRILDPDPALRPEMLAQVQFLTVSEGRSRVASNESVAMPIAVSSVQVPADAVHGTGKDAYVWTVSPERRAQQRTVEAGDAQGGRVPVSGSVTPADKIIVSADSDLRPGAKVNYQFIEEKQ